MQHSKREVNRRRVRRTTQILAVAAVGATAIFAGAAARASGTADNSDGTAADSTTSDWSSGAISPPASAPTQSFEAPATVSGGS